MTRPQLGDPHLHFWLTRGVARAMGFSFSDAMQDNRLSAQGYAEMVTACRGCVRVDTCKVWLAEQLSVSPSAPPGCVNSDVLEALARPH